MASLKTSRGELVKASLSGAWRNPPFPSLEISQTQLDEVTPLLKGSSAGALGWWRVSRTKFRQSASGGALREAYHFHSVQSVMHEDRIRKVFRLFRGASIEVVLAKGWVAAALYPAAPLRPYHDIDICVKPEDFRAALDLLNSHARDCWVDLHQHFWELDDRNLVEVFARSRLVSLGNDQIRVMGPEDHLALLAIHLLKHGAWRPLWLCDIGAAIESLPKHFDWNVCLGRNRTKAHWITTAIGLAHHLLGAKIDSLPVTRKTIEAPGWLLHSVLRQWEHPFPQMQSPGIHPVPMATYIRRPRGIMKAMKSRWPNPIVATISVNGKFTGLPRLPYQVGNWVQRVGRFIYHPRTVN